MIRWPVGTAYFARHACPFETAQSACKNPSRDLFASLKKLFNARTSEQKIPYDEEDPCIANYNKRAGLGTIGSPSGLFAGDDLCPRPRHGALRLRIIGLYDVEPVHRRRVRIDRRVALDAFVQKCLGREIAARIVEVI